MLIHPCTCIGFHLPSARRVGKPLERDDFAVAIDAEAAAIGLQFTTGTCAPWNCKKQQQTRATVSNGTWFAITGRVCASV